MTHVQTKESFELFLEECLRLAYAVVQPIPFEEPCPFCDGTAALTIEDGLFHQIDEHRWRGQQYFYKCGKCLEEFTTNESDTLSLAEMKLVQP